MRREKTTLELNAILGETSYSPSLKLFWFGAQNIWAPYSLFFLNPIDTFLQHIAACQQMSCNCWHQGASEALACAAAPQPDPPPAPRCAGAGCAAACGDLAQGPCLSALKQEREPVWEGRGLFYSGDGLGCGVLGSGEEQR